MHSLSSSGANILQGPSEPRELSFVDIFLDIAHVEQISWGNSTKCVISQKIVNQSWVREVLMDPLYIHGTGEENKIPYFVATTGQKIMTIWAPLWIKTIPSKRRR